MNNERYIRIAPPSLHQAAARTARRSRRASTLGMFVASVLVFSGTTYAFSQTPLPQLFSDAIATAFTAPRAYVAAVGTALGTSTAQSGEQGNLVASSTSVAATTPIVGGSVASPASVTQITQPVIERVKETERVITVSGVTLDVLNERLKELDNKLSSMIFAITAVPTLPASGGFTNSIALTNRIDQLRGTTITSPTISGATITNSSITSTSVGATSLSADTAAFGTTTVASLTISGTCTGCGSSDPFTHPSATVSATTSGLLITASSTIGDGSQIGGLTISGGATTTGNAYVAGNVGIGTAAPRWSLHVASSTPYVGITDSDAGADQKHWLLSALDGTFRIGKAEDAAPTATTTVLMIQPESNNFTFGDENFTSNVSGIENISIGGGTLLQNTSGSYNTGIGGSSLQSNISGHQNIALGTEALLANTIGAYNVALGNKAGSNITSGSANIAIGYNALVPSATADRQLSIGNLLFGMLPATTSQTTLSLPTSGTFGIGTSSPFAKFAIHTNNGDTATTLFAIGSSTASATTTLFSIGNQGFLSLSTDGGSTLTVNDTAFDYQGPGSLMLTVNGTGFTYGDSSTRGFTFDGTDFSIDNGSSDIGYSIGGNRVLAIDGGNNNTMVGKNALSGAVTGGHLTAVGEEALMNNTSGANNTSVGWSALNFNTIGDSNTAIGSLALQVNTTGSNNTAVGTGALDSSTTGSDNTALGQSALTANTQGQQNIGIGYWAGRNITTGSNNVVVGYNAYLPSATGDNQLNIGNLLFGSLPATTSIFSSTGLVLPTTGSIGIGTSSPFAKFAIHTNNGDTATTLFAIASSTANSTTTFLTVRNTGNVGIGTTNPGSKLTVATTSLSSFTGTDPGTLLLLDSGTVTNNFTTLDFGTLSQGYGTSRIASKYTASGSYLQFGTSNAFGSGITNTALTIDPSGSIGIGTTSPYRLLSLTSAVATAQAAIAYDSSNATELLTSSVGDLFTYPSGNDFLINNGNAWVCTGGSGNTNGCPSGAPSGFGNLIVETKIGIASSTPWTMLALGADGAIMTTEKSLTDGATIAIDWKNGNQQLVTLGGNRAITFSNYIPGMTLRLVLCQDGTGSRTITSWPAVVLWSGGSAPTLTTTANKCDIATFLTSSATGTVKVLGSTVQSF